MVDAIKNALVASVAAWGDAKPRFSGEYEWGPGCIHHRRTTSVLGYERAYTPHPSKWLRLRPFSVQGELIRYDDAVDIHQKRAFVDIVSLLSTCGSRENRRVWQDVIHQCVGSSPNSFDQGEDDDSDPRFMLDFQGTQCDIPKLEWCFSFLTALTVDVLSPETQFQFASTFKWTSQVPRWIAVGLDLSKCLMTTSQLNKLYEMLKAYAAYESDQDVCGRCKHVEFVVTSLVLSRSEHNNPRDYEILADIMQLQSPRVRVRHLNMAHSFACSYTMDERTAFQCFIQRVLRDDASSLEELVLEGLHVWYAHYTTVLSAVRYSTKLKALRFDQPVIDDIAMNDLWLGSWLALSVLHPSSQSQLTALAIPLVHINQYVENKIHQTLTRECPALVTLEVSGVRPNVSGCPAGRKFVTIKRGTKLRDQPKTRSTVLSLSKYAIDRPLEVAAFANRWTCVIVPGYGFGWVKATAVVSQEERDVVQNRAISLRSFVWAAPNHQSTINRLIPLIGSGLQELYLFQVAFLERHVQAILLNCPFLQHLDVKMRVHIRSLNVVCEMLNSSLRSFTIRFISSLQDHVSMITSRRVITELTTILTTPIGRQVRSMTFEYNKVDYQQVEALHSAIRHHPRLERVEAIELSDSTPAFLIEGFKALDDQTIGARDLPRETKVAFLSTICQRSDAPHEHPRHRLDSVLVSIIFDFSADPIRRRVNTLQGSANAAVFESTLHITK